MEATITKLDAAGILLNRAIELYLDASDCVSAIVLAGSAEDLLQGILTGQGRSAEAARVQMLSSAQEIAQRLDPGGGAASEKDTINLMRGMFNWLRHNDKKDDPDAVTWHLDVEAETVIMRALQNWDVLGGAEPVRAVAFVTAAGKRNEAFRAWPASGTFTQK
ncbi:hypothetical protein [Variovorax sp. PBL-E5]|uniref:hypothetical protein n=1 Tax=Variovorax sp. PBL-E5 TaxID=434014 RepID=UPI00131601D1|nr:hypothetical protein [Variovorax sp. PBL-E5]VTU28499.1 hypothetical protein E5CHR_02621 [Variovorax sp. PBL-E5]